MQLQPVSGTAAEMLVAADEMEAEMATLENAMSAVSNVRQALAKGTALLRRGLCNFVGS